MFFASMFNSCKQSCKDNIGNSYPVDEAPAGVRLPEALEAAVPGIVDEVAGRQLLHVTFGSVLTHAQFKPQILENLDKHPDLHAELLDKHFSKHLRLLSQG